MNILKNTTYFIYAIQITIFVVIAAIALYYEQFFRLMKKKQEKLKKILVTTIEQELPLHFLPASLKHLYVCLPILEELNRKVSGIFWEQLKESIIYDFLYFELQNMLNKEKWDAVSWGLRAIRLCPKVEYEAFYLRYISHENESLRLLAIDGALKLQTDHLICGLLKQIAEPNEYYKFPYIDGFLKSESVVWIKVFKIYREDPLLRPAALRILSYRSGFLAFEDIQRYMETFSAEARWWAIEALKNIPCEESVSYLLKELHAARWEDRLHALYLLGKLRVEPHPSLEALTKDPQRDVRLAALWALSHHQKVPPGDFEEYLQIYPSSEIEEHLQCLSNATQPSLESLQ